MSTMETAPYQIVVLRLEQHRLWLVRPMREWQSLLHKVQMLVLEGGGIHEQRVHCKETGAGKNPSVGHFVPPALEGQSGQIYEGDKEGLLLLPALLL